MAELEKFRRAQVELHQTAAAQGSGRQGMLVIAITRLSIIEVKLRRISPVRAELASRERQDSVTRAGCDLYQIACAFQRL